MVMIKRMHQKNSIEIVASKEDTEMITCQKCGKSFSSENLPTEASSCSTPDCPLKGSLNES